MDGASSVPGHHEVIFSLKKNYHYHILLHVLCIFLKDGQRMALDVYRDKIY